MDTEASMERLFEGGVPVLAVVRALGTWRCPLAAHAGARWWFARPPIPWHGLGL